jgi:PIN domain nuclease of toxin-antitoxin system
MNLLLDTHTLLWWLADDAGLSTEARATICDAKHVVYVSAATAWEISIKRALGKLNAPGDLDTAVSASGFREMPITFAHAEAAGQLPMHHSDPFDRMLVAQAKLEFLTLVTRDERMEVYGIPLVKA